jgi:uncharacterized protein YdeI (YjbR/CyaY-like superfamily)
VTPRFFATPAAFRKWLDANHATAGELLVGFYKVGTGRPSITWPESVDEALCVGWIDGVRKRVDDDSYTIRFTPRKAGSIWSAVNIAKMAELIRQGRVRPAGLKAFAARSAAKSGVYAYEQRASVALDEASDALFRADAAAWADWQARPAWYRKTATWWVVSAKKEETRRKRLAILIAACAQGQPIPTQKRPGRGEPRP